MIFFAVALEIAEPADQTMPRVTITVPDKMPQPYRFQLDRRVVMIGRGSENDIAVECGSISVKHAEMVRIDGGYELRDLGSTNGIKLDGERHEVIPLRHGASVKLGDVAFDFELSEEEREALRREKVLDDEPVSKVPAELAPAVKEAAAESEVAPKKRAAGASSDGGGGFIKFVLILLFALLAFFAGLAIRHYKETGGWLLNAIQSKTKTLKANREAQTPPAQSAPAMEPAAPAPPAVTAPAAVR